MRPFLRWFCPSSCVDSVTQIDADHLTDLGIRALLLDLDNTLVPWRSYDISPEVASWIKGILDRGLKCCIVSNTRTPRRLKELGNQLNVPYIKKGLKPRRGGFREALSILDVPASSAVVIGDQIFTDILGGNRLGLHTILVRPLDKREFVGTKVSRLFEKVILRLLRHFGMIDRAGVECHVSGEQMASGSSHTKSEQ